MLPVVFKNAHFMKMRRLQRQNLIKTSAPFGFWLKSQQLPVQKSIFYLFRRHRKMQISCLNILERKKYNFPITAPALINQ